MTILLLLIELWSPVLPGRPACDALLLCDGDTCEAYVLTCAIPWTLDTCLYASVPTPDGDVSDVLGCSPDARTAALDPTPWGAP